MRPRLTTEYYCPHHSVQLTKLYRHLLPMRRIFYNRHPREKPKAKRQPSERNKLKRQYALDKDGPPINAHHKSNPVQHAAICYIRNRDKLSKTPARQKNKAKSDDHPAISLPRNHEQYITCHSEIYAPIQILRNSCDFFYFQTIHKPNAGRLGQAGT